MTEETRVCEHCGRWIEKNEILYRMLIVIQAEPTQELEMPDEDEDLLEQIQKLVEKMENMTEEEVEEATSQVHESYHFALCGECRGIIHGRLKRRTGLIGPD